VDVDSQWFTDGRAIIALISPFVQNISYDFSELLHVTILCIDQIESGYIQRYGDNDPIQTMRLSEEVRNDGKTGREGCDRNGRGTRFGSSLREAAGRIGCEARGRRPEPAVVRGNSRPKPRTITADGTIAEIGASGGAALGIAVGVRDHEAIEASWRVVQEWGRVDLPVANTGGGRGRPIDTKASSLDPALLQLVTEMNLFGTVCSYNAVAPIMKQQRSGKIITVSSVAGIAPSADGGYSHYGAAKAAIAHHTRYLVQDLGPFGITANCISPGVIATGRIMAAVIRGSVQSNRD
jgi:NAD(P)-dependent dehydrogenase (short-subunit alcohol dehydrogenase family)